MFRFEIFDLIVAFISCRRITETQKYSVLQCLCGKFQLIYSILLKSLTVRQ